MLTVYKYCYITCDICKKKFTCFQMTLSCAIDRQQNMLSFDIRIIINYDVIYLLNTQVKYTVQRYHFKVNVTASGPLLYT